MFPADQKRKSMPLMTEPFIETSTEPKFIYNTKKQARYDSQNRGYFQRQTKRGVTNRISQSIIQNDFTDASSLGIQNATHNDSIMQFKLDITHEFFNQMRFNKKIAAKSHLQQGKKVYKSGSNELNLLKEIQEFIHHRNQHVKANRRNQIAAQSYNHK